MSQLASNYNNFILAKVVTNFKGVDGGYRKYSQLQASLYLSTLKSGAISK